MYLGNTQVGYLEFIYPNDKARYRNIEITWIEIYKKYRKRKYGTLLLEYFIDTFKDKVWISLWTSKEMEKNKSYTFYTKVGFKEAIVQDDYYAKGIPTRLFILRNKGLK